MGLFKNKFRIESARLANWDYGRNAAYFVTICIADRGHSFGEITGSKMHLSVLGERANECWLAIPGHFPFVQLGVHIVMPNHVHGIIIINKPNAVTPHRDVETQNFASLHTDDNHIGNKFGPQSKNLASIVRGFKIGVTKFAKDNQLPFKWQQRFHDHIIRSEESFIKIQNYILTNPERWTDDKFYTV